MKLHNIVHFEFPVNTVQTISQILDFSTRVLSGAWVVILADTSSSRLALICFPEHQRQRSALIAPQVQVARGRWAQPVHSVQPVHSIHWGNPILVLYRSWVFPTRSPVQRVHRVHTASRLNWTRVNVINTTCILNRNTPSNACFAFSI